MSLLPLFFYTTMCKLFLLVPLSASQSVVRVWTRRLPNILELLGYLLQFKYCTISKCWPQTCLILSSGGHEGFSYATVLLDYASVERQWGKSGETLTSSNQRLLKSNLSVQVLKAYIKAKERLNLDDVHHMKQVNVQQYRLLENHLSKHTEHRIKEYCGRSYFQSSTGQTHSHSSQ